MPQAMRQLRPFVLLRSARARLITKEDLRTAVLTPSKRAGPGAYTGLSARADASLDPLRLRSGRMSRLCERVRKRLRFFARGRSGGAAAVRADLSARAPAAGPRGWSIQVDLLRAPDGWGALP